jgi:hypothetical protein
MEREKMNSERVMSGEQVISTGDGTPIFVVPRRNGGVLLAQGSSHILLSRKELNQLFAVTRDAHNGPYMPR